jgi:hypothetical protein
MLRAWVTLVLIGCAPPPSSCPCATPKPEPTPSCPAAPPPAPPTPPSLTCGQLALREARLVSLGKGDKHPDLMAVRARLAECANRKPTPEECAAVRKTGAELAKDHGPKHPEMIANAAEQAVCDHP